MQARLALATAFLLIAACGDQPPAIDKTAALNLNLTVEGVDLRPYAADETAAILESVQPISIQFLVCDNIELNEQIRQFCALDANNYNYEERVSVSGNSGTLEILGIPAARDQVVIAQGIAADDKVTYQGFVTIPVLEPRGVYPVALTLKQTAYPPLPPPEAPVLTSPASTPFTIATGVTSFTFEGTREAATYIRITAPTAFGLGNFVEYSQSKAPYEETEFSDRIEWSFPVNVDPNRLDRTIARSYVFTFEAARDGEDKFSEKTTVTMHVCDVNGNCP